MSGVDGYNPLPSDTEKEARDKEAQGEALRTAVPDWVRSGMMVKNVRLDPAEIQSVQHGLKRVPQGWLLMSVRSQPAASSSNHSITEMSRDVNKIALANVGTNGTVYFDLWVW